MAEEKRIEKNPEGKQWTRLNVYLWTQTCLNK